MGNGYVAARVGGTLSISDAGTQVTGRRLDAMANGAIVVENAAALDLTQSMFVGFPGAGALTIQSGGSAAIGIRAVFGASSGNTGIGTISGAGSSLTCLQLGLGGQDGTLFGGTGTVLVESGATVQATNQTTFFTAESSLTINGGTLSTGSLATFDQVNAALAISDPAEGAAITVGVNDSSSTFDGTIADAAGGPGSLAKVGSGSLTLTNANTYSGGTTIDSGTLFAENVSGSATGSGDVQINNGTLGGSGIVEGAVDVSAGGAVAPGTSAGILTVGSVEFQSGSTFSVELAGSGGVAGTDFDQLFAADGATIQPGATLDLTYLGGFTAAPGDEFVILTALELFGFRRAFAA